MILNIHHKCVGSSMDMMHAVGCIHGSWILPNPILTLPLFAACCAAADADLTGSLVPTKAASGPHYPSLFNLLAGMSMGSVFLAMMLV